MPASLYDAKSDANPEARRDASGADGSAPRQDRLDTLSVRELYETGCSVYDEGDPERALAYLRSAYEREPENAAIRSHYALCMGLVERRFGESVDLCQSAAKQEFFNPDLYLNLARLHLGFGFKSEGIRFLRRGLMIDPGNARIVEALKHLGDRRSPVLRFLPRRHPLNRWLGAARARVSRTFALSA